MNVTGLSSWFGLSGTSCIVAGANGLLGRESCRALIGCGADVLGLDLSFSAPTYGETRDLDITQEQALNGFFTELESSQRAKTAKAWAFINCSYPRTQNWASLRFDNVTMNDWNRNVELHLGSTFLFTQNSVRFLEKQIGRAHV